MSQQRTADVVLGVDPGLTRCGIGVVSGPPARPEHIHHACVRTTPEQPLEERLLAIHAGITDAIRTHRPGLVAVERVLFSKNVRTAMSTGQSAGVAMLAASQAGLSVQQLTPTDVKLTVAGDGNADKEGVARMVTAQLRLDARPTPADAADALAVAMAAMVRLRTPAVVAGGSWEQLVEARGLRIAGGTA